MSKDPSLITIHAHDLLSFDDYTQTYPLRTDCVYAKQHHRDNIFKTAIYRHDAQIWGHHSLVRLTLRAAEICYQQSKLLFEIKDCLRPLEAQALMLETDIVKKHPEWLIEPRLLSPPGKGGHPRGMAVDITLITENGEEIDMGTVFDHLTEDKKNNPAARSHTEFGKGDAYNKMVLENRQLLENCMQEAAKEAGQEILPLPQEWWDFRFLPAFSNGFHPLSDNDLPPTMRMTAD